MDKSRYKLLHSKWYHSGDGDPHCEGKLRYIHPDSPSEIHSPRFSIHRQKLDVWQSIIQDTEVDKQQKA